MNYIFYGGLFRLTYLYVDAYDNKADSLFCRHKIPVRFKGDYIKDGEPYKITVCKIRKKYKAEFEKALNELTNKMELLGLNDYTSFCEQIVNQLKKALE